MVRSVVRNDKIVRGNLLVEVLAFNRWEFGDFSFHFLIVFDLYFSSSLLRSCFWFSLHPGQHDIGSKAQARFFLSLAKNA